MKILDRYTLDLSKTLAYLQDNLSGTNLLSSEICKLVEFKNGVFYTLLPKNLTDEQLYGFKWGGLGGNVREKVVDLLFHQLQNNPELLCIFDDIDGTYTPSYDEESFLQTGVHFEDQIYYLVDKKNASKEFLGECLQTSNAFWHSLCVLSNVRFIRPDDRSITQSEMSSFAKGAEMIFLGAYDGEGYICWEKTNF